VNYVLYLKEQKTKLVFSKKNGFTDNFKNHFFS